MKQSSEIWYCMILLILWRVEGRYDMAHNVDVSFDYNVDDVMRTVSRSTTFSEQFNTQSSPSGRVPWPLGWERCMGRPQLQRWHLHGLLTKTEHLSRHVRRICQSRLTWLAEDVLWHSYLYSLCNVIYCNNLVYSQTHTYLEGTSIPNSCAAHDCRSDLWDQGIHDLRPMPVAHFLAIMLCTSIVWRQEIT